ncbi:MAG TPA: cytochrome b/b6 domain-containing protein [Steroidobacteraceae bacterium]|jgi:cytochrome b561|nr:cytochrome b/b6 domain-containing protein [Steroidobacteraceae bacterium]
MRALNTPDEYGVVSRTLHWIIVLAIGAQWLLAEAGDDAMALHQSVGMSVLALALVRLLWRLFNPAPAWPADMKPFEIRLARAVHIAFYVLLLAIPLSGWALSSVEEEPLRFFNLIDIPRFVLGSEDSLEEVHELLFNILVALAALHALGAAKHWIARRKRGAAIH